jgi:esterase
MELSYKHYGSEGHPLIIVHGLLGAGGNWHTLASRVFSTRFSVFTVDLRNHGRSPHADRFDYPAMVEDLLGFMDAHDIESAHLLGHSMGGKVVMHFALDHPGKTSRVLVADVSPRTYEDRHSEILEALQDVEPSQYGSRQEIDEALGKQILSAPVRQFLMKNLVLENGTYRWQINLDALISNYPKIIEGLEEDDRQFPGPVLFVAGGRSNYVGEADLPLIRRLFPAAEMKTIPGAGHWLHAEAPEEFAGHVMDFLDGRNQPAASAA